MHTNYVYFTIAQESLVGLSLLITQDSQSHTVLHTTHGRTPLDEWSARLKSPLSDSKQHSQETDIHAPGGIRTQNPSKWEVEYACVKPRGHWGRLSSVFIFKYKLCAICWINL